MLEGNVVYWWKYTRTGVWMWKFHAEYKHNQMMETCIEGVMVDRKISRKLKGKVLDFCVVPDKENSRSKESGETANERPARRSWAK